MKTYEDFIEGMGDVPSFPQDVYGKVKFRITVDKYVLPAVLTLPIFVFAGIFLFLGQTSQPSLDFLAETEEIVFAQSNFYSLLDD